MFCGLDFGTSNSTLGVMTPQGPRLVALEGAEVTLPSALFFNYEDHSIGYGRAAIDTYLEGREGRLMRALKSILGTPLMADRTQVKYQNLPFTEILGIFLAELKRRAEAKAGAELTQVVLGRPVHFVDDSPERDAAAQAALEAVARAQGFEDVLFQYEPIAAALHYERQVVREELALIADLGGGTSDFTLIRLSPARARQAERTQDILANEGIHIGGTDFDRLFSMAAVLPAFGLGSKVGEKGLEMPRSLYFDLASWVRIAQVYTKATLFDVRRLRHEAHEPERIDRLLAVLEQRRGHALAAQVEAAKIALASQEACRFELALEDEEVSLPLQRAQFEAAIRTAQSQLRQTVQATLKAAGVPAEAVQAVFLTGGSTRIPLVREGILAIMPHAKVVEGDTFGSVGLGLALDAARRFG